MISILSGSVFDILFKQILFCTWQTVNDVTDSSLWSLTASESSSTLITSEKKGLSQQYYIEVELNPTLITIQLDDLHQFLFKDKDIWKQFFNGLIISR